MNTFRELIYMCIDKLKLLSDDAYYTEDHIIFLLNKYRAFLLKQRYSDIKKQVPQGNYQTLDLEFNETDYYSGEPCESTKTYTYYVSTEPVPFLMLHGTPRVYFDDTGYFRGEITYVTKDRMRYVGNNRFTKAFTYCTIGPDNYLYLKRPALECKEETGCALYYGACFDNQRIIHITGVFEDATGGKDNNDIYDDSFPIEDALVPPLIELVVKDLSQFRYTPDDKDNNSNDDLTDLQVRQQNE